MFFAEPIKLPHAVVSVGLCLAIVCNAFGIDFDGTFGISGKFMTSFADSGQHNES